MLDRLGGDEGRWVRCEVARGDEGCRIGDDVMADEEGLRVTGPGRGRVRFGEERMRAAGFWAR